MTDRDTGPGRSPRKIYPWSMSATGGFGEDQLFMLQHYDVEELVEWFDEKPYGIMIGIMEILGHGNDRKAIEIARGLVGLNPAHERRFSEVMDERTMEYWFRKPLEEIPSQPSEIRGPVEFVQ